MAFSSQNTPSSRVTVSVDLPQLPATPRMTLSQDQAAMAAYNSALSAWYEALKTSLLDKLNSLASEINSLKKG